MGSAVAGRSRAGGMQARKPTRGAGRRRELGWLAALVACVLVAGLVPLVQTPRFYFFGDTQAGAMGQWYFLGEKLLAGAWPMMEPSQWRAGNFTTEGQLGLFSPLTMLIAVLSTRAGNLVVFATLVKLALLTTGAIGTYLLTRSYRTPPWAGFLAGLTVTVGGTTRYLESPSWVTGQMIWALLPLLWWFLRRMVLTRANPVGALVTGYLIVTVGYVYGVFFIAMVVIATIVDALVLHRRSRAIAVLGVGVCCALVAVTVYLPAVLTAPVTVRSSSAILSDGSLNGSLLGIVVGFLPYPTIAYVAWFIPALAFLDPAALGRVRSSLAGLIVVLVFATLWVLGPNQIGPLRWPARVMPELVLPGTVLITVLLSRCRLPRPGAGRLGLAVGWCAVGGWLTASRDWTDVGGVAAFALLSAVGVSGCWLLWRRGARSPGPWRLRATTAAVACLALWTLVVVAAQYALEPRPPSLDRNMPSTIDGYRTQASTVVGDAVLIGNPAEAMVADPGVTAAMLVGNSWYLTPHRFQSTYSVTSFAAYSRRFCMRYDGTTCAKALDTLFRRDSLTGRRRVDLLAISSVYIFKPDFPERNLSAAPAGWRVAAQDRISATWVRDQPIPTAGGVVDTSGVTVQTVSQTDTTVRLRVGTVKRDGARVVLSRIRWPGYSVRGAGLAPATDGYLLTLDVPRSASGTEITVRFRPPGWTVEIVTLASALLLLASWSIWHSVLLRRCRGAMSDDSNDPLGAPRS